MVSTVNEGYILGAVALGDLVLSRLRPAQAEERNRRIIAACVTLLVLGLLTRIPIVGGLLGLLVLLVGLGSMLQQFRRTNVNAPA